MLWFLGWPNLVDRVPHGYGPHLGDPDQQLLDLGAGAAPSDQGWCSAHPQQLAAPDW